MREREKWKEREREGGEIEIMPVYACVDTTE